MKDSARSVRHRAASLGGSTLAAACGLIASVAAPMATGGALVGAATTLLASPALAQAAPQAVDPYFVIVTQDQAPLLAGAVESHYRVALLPIGTIVRVTHSMDGWMLVEYPRGTPAYARASEVTPSPDARTVRTNVPSRLRAANMESTSAGSWASLLSEPLAPLPAGTELRVLSVENKADGTPSFYKVVAPSQARGFLRAGLFRNATPQETQDHLNRLAMAEQGATPPPTTPASSDQPAQTPAVVPVTPPARTPTATDSPATPTAQPLTRPTQLPSDVELQPTGLDNSLLSEPVAPTAGDRPASTPTSTPAGNQPLVIDQSGAITGGDGGPGAEPPTTDPVTLTVDGLEAAFEEIRQLPVREAEYEELIARFEQVINTLSDSREDLPTKRGLQARADLLRLRQDYRDSLLALDEGRRDARDLAARAAERIDWLRTQGGYAVVGRLVPSNIYDGSSGPLMYRVVAVNTEVPRTLAYVKMDDEFTLPELVGKVIGVRGQVTVDPTIGTRIVQAESVDEVNTAP